MLSMREFTNVTEVGLPLIHATDTNLELSNERVDVRQQHTQNSWEHYTTSRLHRYRSLLVSSGDMGRLFLKPFPWDAEQPPFDAGLDWTSWYPATKMVGVLGKKCCSLTP
jgi:hypothetical protein